jgi:hypothetical protein
MNLLQILINMGIMILILIALAIILGLSAFIVAAVIEVAKTFGGRKHGRK